MPPDPTNLSLTLHAAATGDPAAAEKLLPLVYDELRRLAQARLAALPAATLQPTALVHEAFIKLVGSGDPGWNGKNHFFAAAANAMRFILVDHARRKSAAKRGGRGGRGGNHERIDLSLAPGADGNSPEDVLALDEALKKLEAQDVRKARIVSLRCFGGLSQAEVAAALEVSERTIERDWRFISVWLRREMSGDNTNSEGGAGNEGANG